MCVNVRACMSGVCMSDYVITCRPWLEFDCGTSTSKHVRTCVKCTFLCSAVSSPWDCAERFTFHPLADLTLHPLAYLTLHPLADLTLHPLEDLTLHPLAYLTLHPLADLTLHPLADLTLHPLADLTFHPLAYLTLHPLAVHSNAISTYPGSIKPRCNYCAKNIRSHIHLYL